MSKFLMEAVTMDDAGIDEPFIEAGIFEDATRTMVRTLGRAFNLDVVFAGMGAATDGKIVTLPSQSASKMMTRRQYAVTQGYANHETLHNLCTEMERSGPLLKTMKESGKKLTALYANAIEDIRIERAGQRLYPGMPSQLSATADYTAKRSVEKILENEPDAFEKLNRIGPMAVTWRGRQRMGYTSPYTDKAVSMLSPDVLSKVDEWLDHIEAIETGATRPGVFDQGKSYQGTHDAIAFAQKIVEEEEQKDEEEEEQEQKQESKSQSGTQLALGGGEPIDEDTMQAVSELLLGNEKNGDAYRPVTTALDLVATRDSHSSHVRQMLCSDGGQQMYRTIMDNLGGKIVVMKRKLERALLAAAEVQHVSGQRTGRIDIRRQAAHILRGRENIYKRRIDGKDVDTAVTILVDISGSMSSNGKMDLATQTCIALAECLERTGVALEILCFQTGCIHDAFSLEVVAAAEAACSAIKFNTDGDFHRSEPIVTWVIKDFEDSLRKSRISLGGMLQMSGNSNADGDSILVAAKRLRARKERKHILLVLSDGEPAYDFKKGCSEEHTKNCADYVTSLGVHVVGIGITTSSVKKYYKNYSIVRKVNDLDKEVMVKVAKLILGEDFKVDNADVSGAASNYKAA